MRVLVFNHFFDQDINALTEACGSHEMIPIPFQFFRSKAVKVLGREITEGELEVYNQEENELARGRWAQASESIFKTLYSVYRFDLFVAPSDTFFYIRDFIACCHDKGIPVVVLQKETTISPYTMEVHSRRIGNEFPFISDKMLVCSSRQKQFWLNAGAAEDKIDISGQPRFDIYAHKSLERNWKDLGLPIGKESKVVLFFSYDLDAYAPSEDSTSENATWKQLRDETEDALLDLAGKGYVVLIKPHPQQRSRLEVKQLARKAGPHWQKQVFWIDRVADARRLILYADHVVGFQTTALYEAMLAGKPVIYTHWTAPVRQFEDKLIPFWENSGALTVVQSRSELVHAVETGEAEVTGEMMAQRRDLAVEHIGEIDGLATRRAWSEFELWVEKSHKAESPEPGLAIRLLWFFKGTILYLTNRAGMLISSPVFLVLSFLSNFFPSLSKGSASNKDGLKTRFRRFALFWKGFARQSLQSSRREEK